MAGDEMRRIDELNTQGTQDCNRVCHDRRLRIFGELELFFGSVAHEPKQALPKRLVDLIEHIAGGTARASQRHAHADRLAALSRKNECAH